MTLSADNVVPFPLARRRELRACPLCGTQSRVYRIGRLLWGCCEQHELRWVVADLKRTTPEAMDRQQLRRRLEFLSGFIEVSH